MDRILGAFFNGQIYDELYNPEQLILDSVVNETPVIYIAMNYRLGSKFSEWGYKKC